MSEDWRSGAEPSQKIGSLTINRLDLTIEINGKRITLPRRLFMCLSYLIHRGTQVIVSRSELKKAVYGANGTNPALDMLVCRLRKACRGALNHNIIKMKYGGGYYLNPPL